MQILRPLPDWPPSLSPFLPPSLPSSSLSLSLPSFLPTLYKLLKVNPTGAEQQAEKRTCYSRMTQTHNGESLGAPGVFTDTGVCISTLRDCRSALGYPETTCPKAEHRRVPQPSNPVPSCDLRERMYTHMSPVALFLRAPQRGPPQRWEGDMGDSHMPTSSQRSQLARAAAVRVPCTETRRNRASLYDEAALGAGSGCTRHARSRTYCLWQLHTLAAEPSSRDRTRLARKAENMSYLSLYRQSMPSPVPLPLQWQSRENGKTSAWPALKMAPGCKWATRTIAK